MGRTRRRVTVLVLSLEGIGLLLVAAAIWLAGGERVVCSRGADLDRPGSGSTRTTCVAEVRRVFGLVAPSRRRLEGVVSASVGDPGLGRAAHWLVLTTGDGEAVRVLAGSRTAAQRDVDLVTSLLSAQASGESVTIRRSNLLPAAVLAAFGCLWLVVISLIMREFLGFHTPWWWRVLGRDVHGPRPEA